jgi:hypothetical protein
VKGDDGNGKIVIADPDRNKLRLRVFREEDTIKVGNINDVLYRYGTQSSRIAAVSTTTTYPAGI